MTNKNTLWGGGNLADAPSGLEGGEIGTNPFPLLHGNEEKGLTAP